MILCSACANLYHGGQAAHPQGIANAHCEACGGELGAADGRFRRPLTAIAVTLALSAGVAFLGGKAVVMAIAPAAAPLLSALGLASAHDLVIDGVHARVSGEGDRAVLAVEGELVNAQPREAQVPDLDVTLVGADGSKLYTWRAHAPKPTLAPGERESFRTRLEAPPAGVAQALVKFATVGDKFALAGKDR
jgi:hypothetical protein